MLAVSPDTLSGCRIDQATMLLLNNLVCECFSGFDGSPPCLLLDQRPYSSAASTSEQPQLAVGGPTAQELQHRRRVGAVFPLLLRHVPYSFRRMRSTAQHPRTCGPVPRRCPSSSALSHPASSRASASTARPSGSRVPAGRTRWS